ncbi:hypothetical protein BH23ACT2_BH23ACT2_02360 [soil metagenome]
MLNNTERMDPLGEDEASATVRTARGLRRLTALDEGQAWRRRSGQVLAVLRTEVFADDDDGGHRAAWLDRGVASLGSTWRERWRERDVVPGWIEARWVKPSERPDPLHVFSEARPASDVAASVDWARVEDHTGGHDDVTVYEHLTIWCGRAQATLTVRHGLGLDVDAEATAAAVSVYDRLCATGLE